MQTNREKVLDALAFGDMTPAELVDFADVSIRSLYNGTPNSLKGLRDAGEIHVFKWMRNTVGPAVPVYRLGPGESPEKPAPIPNAEKAKKYRHKHPAKVRKAKNKWRAKNTEKVNKQAKVSRAKRIGIPLVQVIDPLLAIFHRRPEQQNG